MGTYPSLTAQTQQKACGMNQRQCADIRGSKEEQDHAEGYVDMSPSLREARIVLGLRKWRRQSSRSPQVNVSLRKVNPTTIYGIGVRTERQVTAV